MLKRLIVVVAVIAALAVPASAASGAAGGKTIVETAAASKQFSTLVSLVKKAGLVGTLRGLEVVGEVGEDADRERRSRAVEVVAHARPLSELLRNLDLRRRRSVHHAR